MDLLNCIILTVLLTNSHSTYFYTQIPIAINILLKYPIFRLCRYENLSSQDIFNCPTSNLNTIIYTRSVTHIACISSILVS